MQVPAAQRRPGPLAFAREAAWIVFVLARSAWAYVLWKAALASRFRSSLDRPERFTVVLLSFKRPENMQAIVDGLLLCDFVERVIVFNNNGSAYAIRDWVRSDDSRVELRDSAENKAPIVRLSLSLESAGERFIAIDDDIFLRPSQLRTIAAGLLDDPAAVHGMFGSAIEDAPDGSVVVRRGLHGFDGPIDLVQRVYCYTRKHAEAALAFAERIRPATDVDLGFADDILLSMGAGSGPNRCHDVGPFLDAFSSTKKGVALYREPGFQERRDGFIALARSMR